MFGGYLVIHLLVNATIVQYLLGDAGREMYQAQVDKIHSLPFLPLIEWTFIYLPIIFHIIYGIWIIITGQPNNANYPFYRNWHYLFQRITGMYLVAFILFHVLAFKYGLFGNALAFDAHGRAIQTVAMHFDVSFLITWIVYPLGVLAACYHLANGFWVAAITWGLAVSAGAQRRWGWVCVGLFTVTFVAGMVSLIAGAVINPTAMPSAAAGH